MKDIRINFADFKVKNGKGSLVILFYSGSGDPKKHLDLAVQKLFDSFKYVELIESSLTMPYMRVIICGINEMHQEPLNIEQHRLDIFSTNISHIFSTVDLFPEETNLII